MLTVALLAVGSNKKSFMIVCFKSPKACYELQPMFISRQPAGMNCCLFVKHHFSSHFALHIDCEITFSDFFYGKLLETFYAKWNRCFQLLIMTSNSNS